VIAATALEQPTPPSCVGGARGTGGFWTGGTHHALEHLYGQRPQIATSLHRPGGVLGHGVQTLEDLC
jgi:hypothetical protein